MTTLKLSYGQALQVKRRNEFATWFRLSGPEGEVSSDPATAASRIHSGFARIYASQLSPMAERRFFAMGSCFARVIENVLRARGASVLSANQAPYLSQPHLFKLKEQYGLMAFLNRYNLPSMLQELRALARWPEEADPPDWLLYPNGDTWTDLNLHFVLQGVSQAECRERRTLVRRTLSDALSKANTVILTLGLCEAWFDLSAGAYLNVCPPPRVATAERGRFEWHFLDYNDNLQALEGIHEILSGLKGDNQFEIVVTVSPIPLNVTFASQDIVVANSEAKSILRAVAGEAVRRLPRCRYFPSYEIVMNSDPAVTWGADRLHTQRPIANHIVANFLKLIGDHETGTPD